MKQITMPLSAVLLLFILLSSGSVSFSQQPSNITHYMFTGMAINPAFAGGSDAICVTGLARQQWIALKDDDGDISPQTIFITIDGPLKFLHGGVGGVIAQDKVAGMTNLYVKLDYAYIANVGQGTFSVGAQLDVINTKIYRDWKPIQSEDPALSKDIKDDLTLDAGLGVLYTVPDKYFIGLSADQILESYMKKIFFSLKRTYKLHGGYNWQVPGKPAFEIQPTAMIRTDLGSVTVDLSALLMYNKKFWGGVSYRYQDMAAILLGLNIKGVKVGLSYDLGLSKLTHYQNGTIEVMASYCFKIKTEKYRKSYRNTRFL